MTHIMLPIFILPVLGAMRNIDRALIRAAASMGASRSYTYRRVFLPLAAPGIAAGAILVFVMSLGFYVTPPPSWAAATSTSSRCVSRAAFPTIPTGAPPARSACCCWCSRPCCSR